MRLCDFFYSDYGYLVCNYGWVEGETYDIVDGKPITNDFFNDRDIDINVAYKSMYTSDGDFGYVYPNFNFDYGSDTLMEAAELWTVPEDQPNAKYTTLPGNMKLNADETGRVSNALLDLQTYSPNLTKKHVKTKHKQQSCIPSQRPPARVDRRLCKKGGLYNNRSMTCVSRVDR